MARSEHACGSVLHDFTPSSLYLHGKSATHYMLLIEETDSAKNHKLSPVLGDIP